MVCLKVFTKLRVTFYLIICRDKILFYSCHHIELHISVAVKVIDIKRTVYFNIGPDEKFIEFL